MPERRDDQEEMHARGERCRDVCVHVCVGALRHRMTSVRSMTNSSVNVSTNHIYLKNRPRCYAKQKHTAQDMFWPILISCTGYTHMQ